MTDPLFMVDTGTCIFLMCGESKKLKSKVQSIPLQQQVMSAVTFSDLTYGAQASAVAKRKQNQTVLDSLVLHLAVLDWPRAAATYYSEIRADLKKRGAQLGAAHLMIAAHARAIGAVVVTNNVKDFGRVKKLEIENWMK